MDKDFYNSASATKLGWEPSWFGCDEFDIILVRAVQKWQRKAGLKADGLVGPMTYRRILTERESDKIVTTPSAKLFTLGQKYIIHNDKQIPIEWDKVVLWNEKNGFEANRGCYTDYSRRPDRKPTMFVNHWDVCLNAETCATVLNRRGISVHFLIDNDGTIYQMLDTQHRAWHAGISNNVGGNEKGIGVEISNAYSLKYQEWYVRNGFGERPVQKNAYVHGRKLSPFLDFYPIQIDALKALWRAVHVGIDIPLLYPENTKGDLETGVHKSCENGKFRGICNHYNFTKSKKDCAGLDLPKLLDEVKQGPLYCIDKND
jgi:hypothetical protein